MVGVNEVVGSWGAVSDGETMPCLQEGAASPPSLKRTHNAKCQALVFFNCTKIYIT